MIVTIGRKSTLLENHEISDHITKELYNQKEYYALILHLFGIYNEDHDTFYKFYTILVCLNFKL